MKRFLPGLFLGIVFATIAQNLYANTDSLLNQLSKAIEKAPDYDAEKSKRIAQLKVSLYPESTKNPAVLFSLYEKLYDEYRIFHYDSAYRYAGKLQEIAYHLGDSRLITEAR